MFQSLAAAIRRIQSLYSIFFVLTVPVFNSCIQQEKPVLPPRVIVMTTDLVKDSTLYPLYDSLHSKEGVWPELRKANMASGIKEIKIYRFDNRLMMVLVLDEDADLSKMDSLYVNADKKVRIWGEMMSGFQQALPGVDSSRKWVEMKLIHHYLDGAYLK